MERKVIVLAAVLLLCGVVSTWSIDLAEFESNALIATDSLLLNAPKQKKKEAAPKGQKKGGKKVSDEVTKLPPGQFAEKQKGMDCQTVALKKPFCVKKAKKVCKESRKCVKHGEFQRVCKRRCLHREKIPNKSCSTTKKNVCKQYYKKHRKTFKCLKFATHTHDTRKKNKECAKWVYKPANARDCKKKGKGSAISCKTYDRTPVCAKWVKSKKGKAPGKYCSKMKAVMKRVCKHVKKITKTVCNHLENKGAGKTFCAVRAKELSCRSFKPCKEWKKAKTCGRACAKEVKTVYACKKLEKKEDKPAPGKVQSKYSQRMKAIKEACERRWTACRSAGGAHHECFKKPEIAKVCGDKGISAKCQYYGFKCRWGNAKEKKDYCPRAKECGEPIVSNKVSEYVKTSFATFTKACKSGVDTCMHNNKGKDKAWCLSNKAKVKEACGKADEYKQKLENLKKSLDRQAAAEKNPKKEEKKPKKEEKKPKTEHKKKF